MFTLAGFIMKIQNGEIAAALNMLKDDSDKYDTDALTAIKRVDPKTNTSLLHELAKLEQLNQALLNEKTSKDAKELLKLVMTRSDVHLQDKLTGRTALSSATASDFGAIASEMLNFIPDKLNEKVQLLQSTDKQKNTVLHHAIYSSNHELIEKILEADSDTHSLFFNRNEDDLYSLALAMSLYRKNPTDLSLSIVNQLYFTLPKGPFRTKAVEEDVYMDWGFFSTAFWRYALRFCAKRDEKGTITGMDLNLLDLVDKVIRDGLSVMGFTVTKDLIFEYSESYSGTPGDKIREAFQTLDAGVVGRTLAQARTNPTLARNKEFMAKATLGEANYFISNMAEDPMVPNNLKQLDAHKDWIVLHEDALFYIPLQKSNDKPRKAVEIKYDRLQEKQKYSFTALKDIIRIAKPGASASASMEDTKKIISILPQIPSGDEGSELKKQFKRRGAGMTLFAKGRGGTSDSNDKEEDQKVDVQDKKIN